MTNSLVSSMFCGLLGEDTWHTFFKLQSLVIPHFDSRGKKTKYIIRSQLVKNIFSCYEVMNRQITAGKPRGMHAYSKLSRLDENPNPAINCHRRFTGRAKGNTIFNLQEREAFLSLHDLRITLLS